MFNLNLSESFHIITESSKQAINDLMQKLKPSLIEEKSNKSLSPITARIIPKSIKKENEFRSKKNSWEEGKKKDENCESHGFELRKSDLPNRIKTEGCYEDTDAFTKASNLILRMNSRRKMLTEMKKQDDLTLRNKIRDSLKKFEEHNQDQEKQKADKQDEIKERILLRRNKSKIRQELNRKSNSIINQLQSFRNSLKNISYDLPISNPEHKQSENSIISPKATETRVYSKSPFLERIQKEEIEKKKEEMVKNLEKKKIREKQQNYSKLIRKSWKESSVFVTD